MLPKHPTHSLHAQASISPSGAYHTTSPISPAAIIGNGQENLMLPPPPRYAADAEKQQHLQWFQQVNMMAMQVPSYSQPQQILPVGYAGYPIAPAFAAPRPAPSVESEEKRAKRLARNRESARQSRRRKKEHLAALGKKVNQLQDVLDEARRLSLANMDAALKEKRGRIVANIMEGDIIDADQLQHVLLETSPNSNVKQEAIRFQYTSMKQALLPNYEEFILWLTLQEEAFFTRGKEEKAKADVSYTLTCGRRKSTAIFSQALFSAQ
jgi:hypothetical protein